jgi:hypothetical protein
MAVLDQNNSEMQNGTAVAESYVRVLWYWKPKSTNKMQKYYHLEKTINYALVWQWKAGRFLLKNGGERSYTNGDIAERGFEDFQHGTRKFIMLADNCTEYSPSLFHLAPI